VGKLFIFGLGLAIKPPIDAKIWWRYVIINAGTTVTAYNLQLDLIL